MEPINAKTGMTHDTSYKFGDACTLSPVASAVPTTGQRTVKYFMPAKDGSVVRTFVKARSCAEDKGSSNAVGSSN